MTEDSETPSHNTSTRVSFDELCQATQLNTVLLIEIIESHLVTPLAGTTQPAWQFDLPALIRVKQATRLRRDLDIEWADIGLVLNLCDEIERLKIENNKLKRQLNRFLS